MTATLSDALDLRRDGWTVHGEVHDGLDVFGIPHGGYLLAMAGKAVVLAAEQPDLFSITTHFLRKARPGPVSFHVTPAGGSRRFTSVQATAVQDGETMLAIMASLGDRDTIVGPSWTDRASWDPRTARLGPPADDPTLAFPTPNVAQRFGMRIDRTTDAWTRGELTGEAEMRVRLANTESDQFVALLAADITPPALWNAVPPTGWVPTVEMTAHVRSRPVPGPMTVEVTTRQLSDGFFDEDAIVRDAAGTLVVQSRQLARWHEPA